MGWGGTGFCENVLAGGGLKGGRESSLALAVATRVPANINIWNNRTVFIVSPRLTSHLRCGFGFGGFALPLKVGGSAPEYSDLPEKTPAR